MQITLTRSVCIEFPLSQLLMVDKVVPFFLILGRHLLLLRKRRKFRVFLLNLLLFKVLLTLIADMLVAYLGVACSKLQFMYAENV